MTGVLIYTALVATLFPLLYLFFPWHETPEGRSIMAFAVGMALLVDLTAIFQFMTPDSALMAVCIELGAFLFAAIAATYKVIVLVLDHVTALRRN